MILSPIKVVRFGHLQHSPEYRRRDPKVEEGIVSIPVLVLAEEGPGCVQGGEEDDEEGGGVLPGVGQVRKSLLGVAITSQALRKTKPRCLINRVKNLN